MQPALSGGHVTRITKYKVYSQPTLNLKKIPPITHNKPRMRIMKWNRIAGFWVLGLTLGGFLPSGESPASDLVPNCQSAEFSTLQDQSNADSMQAGELELLAIVNRERIQQALQPLEMDEELMRLARDHSQEMAQQGFISHDLPSGNLQARMSRAGYLYEVARENVASSQTIVGANQALLNSPPHKENIMAADVTRVGIGVIRRPSSCGHYLYITQVFATPREAYQPETVQNILENRIQDLRQNGSGAMDPDPLLEKLASRSLLSLRTPYDRTELRDLLAVSANELQESGSTGLSQLQVSVQVLHNPKNLSIPASSRGGRARKYGAAVRQITDNRNQPAFLVLTLLGIAQ